MSNAISISAEFEKQKNLQASVYTAVFTGALLLLIIFLKWSLPPKEVPPVDQYVEIILPDEPPVTDVNLGNNDVGSGNVQPIVTGTPSSEPVAQEVAPSRAANVQQTTKDIETEDHKDAPTVTKPTTPRTDAKEINNNTANQTVAAAKPQLRRGAQMTSIRGGGVGGNTDMPGFNKPGTQGPGDGNGDKGQRNGNPNGTKYFGVKEFSIPNQSFEDDFNQNAKIAMEIVTDGTGKVISASYTSKGSTGTATSQMKDIARRRAFQLKVGSDMKGTVIFNFKVSN
jgi:hypothetical protein